MSEIAVSGETVEVVISDNASTDDTERVAKEFCFKWRNVSYHRNPTNVGDQNFPIALGLAVGVFRKLSNDTILYWPGSIKYICSMVRATESTRPVLFFLNMGLKTTVWRCSTPEEFLQKVSFHSTWIGSFGTWDSDYSRLPDKFRGTETHLWQLIVLLKFQRHKEAIVCCGKLFSTQTVPNKDISYGFFKVFYTVFLGILENHGVSERTIGYVKKDLLFNYFSLYLSRLEGASFAHEVEVAYSMQPYFLYFKLFIIVRKILGVFRLMGASVLRPLRRLIVGSSRRINS